MLLFNDRKFELVYRNHGYLLRDYDTHQFNFFPKGTALEIKSPP